jgi:hypothetical protein
MLLNAQSSVENEKIEFYLTHVLFCFFLIMIKLFWAWLIINLLLAKSNQ